MIEVEPLNDSPDFAAGPDQEAKGGKGGDDEKDEGEHDDRRETVVDGWATDIRPGPTNESDQSLGFIVPWCPGARVAGRHPDSEPRGHAALHAVGPRRHRAGRGPAAR